MRAREFLIEYDRKKTAQVISGGEKAEKALIADRGDVGPLDHVRSSLIGLQMDRPVTIPGRRPAFTPPSDYRPAPDKPMIADPIVRARFLEDLLSVIELKDPSPNNIYTPWLARMYVNGGLKMEDMNRGNILGIYDIGKRRRMIRPEHMDINSFKTYKQFEDTMFAKYDLTSIENSEKKEEQGVAEKVYEDSEVLVIVPKDEAAACRYGRGTRWCTAATRGENYFNAYNRRGKLYILIPKNPEHDGEKYQLHFEDAAFMDENDDPIQLQWLFLKRFKDKKLLDFFLTIVKSPDIRWNIFFIDDNILAEALQSLGDLAMNKVYDVLTEWETDDHEYYRYLRNQGYVDEDGDIDWDKVAEAQADYLSYNDEAKDFLGKMQEVLYMPADKFRENIDNLIDTGEDLWHDEPLISILEGLMAALIVHEFRGPRRGEINDAGVAKFINTKIVMDRSGDNWRAELVDPKSNLSGPRDGYI